MIKKKYVLYKYFMKLKKKKIIKLFCHWLDHIYHITMVKRFHIHKTTIMWGIIIDYNNTILVTSNFYRKIVYEISFFFYK